MDENAVQAAWIQARADLGIAAVVPARVEVGGRTIDAIALVPDFGAPNGMVVFADFSSSERRTADEAALTDHGFGFSYLGASYETYEQDLFIDTLNDWGWSSTSLASPDWYTGEAWGE